MPGWIFQYAQLAANLAIVATAVFIFRQLSVAVGHLRVAAQQFLSGIEAQKQNRTVEYIRRWNEAPDQAERTKIFAMLGDHTKSEAEKLAAIEADHALRAQIRTQCNFFEELGIAYHKNLVDKDGLYEFFGYIVKTIYERTRFYIEARRRQERTDKIYENFSEVYNDFLIRMRPPG